MLPVMGLVLAAPLVACFDGSTAHADPPAVSLPPPAVRGVSALGRLEPQDGIYEVAGPSGVAAVIAELKVEEGDRVQRGDVVATLDTVPMLRADIARLKAELAFAKKERERHHELNSNRVVSDSLREERETRVHVVEAQIAHARAQLVRAQVRAPVDGRVLYVHTREGERVGESGILEIGKTDHMYAIAEVYEEDVGRVRVGQRARVSSPALPQPLEGTVEWIHLKVAKQDVLGTDPAARQDARVVEVEVKLDESEAAARYTNLQVDVEIDPQ